MTQIDSLLADLGLSSLQIDDQDRGFAYASDSRWTCGWTIEPTSPLPTC